MQARTMLPAIPALTGLAACQTAPMPPDPTGRARADMVKVLAGESAGGNLAIDTAIWARDKGLQAPVHELLIYPVAGTDVTTPSYQQTTNAVPLNRAAILWYVAHFTRSPADLKDPRLNVVGAADLHGLPPTTIVSADIDPLRSEGEARGQKLTAAGVPTVQRTFPGVTHEFFGMGGVVDQAKQAGDFAAMRVEASFTVPAPVASPPASHHRSRHHHVSPKPAS